MSADLQFKQIIDRILRCREAEDAAKADTKEVYAELKAAGYDKTAAGALVAELRKREKNPDQFTERSAILDLYRDAYDRASHAHTREGSWNGMRIAQQGAVETVLLSGEITDNQELGVASTEAQDLTPSVAFPDAGVACAEGDGDFSRLPTESRSNEISATNSHSQATSSQPAISAGEGVPPPSFSPATPFDIGDIPASLDRRKRVEA